MRLRPIHLVCFLLLLAALGTAHAAPSPAQETALRARVRGQLTYPSFRLEGPPKVQSALDTPSVLLRPACSPAILSTGNHPAARSATLQAFTSILR